MKYFVELFNVDEDGKPVNGAHAMGFTCHIHAKTKDAAEESAILSATKRYPDKLWQLVSCAKVPKPHHDGYDGEVIYHHGEMYVWRGNRWMHIQDEIFRETN